MSEENENNPINEEEYLTSLKQRADLMGITYHPNIGADKLKSKIDLRLSNELDELEARPNLSEIQQTKPAVAVSTTPVIKPMTEEEYKKTTLTSKRREAGKLVRVRVNCMNPNKNDWEGEIMSVGSAKAGTFKKYVPFNLEDGYHIPLIIYTEMLNRKCTVFSTVKGPRGDKIRKGKLINEFAIELLDPLTSAEIKDLAQQQAMSGSID